VNGNPVTSTGTVYSYTAECETSVTLVTQISSGATLTVNGQAYSGGAIALNSDITTIDIEVTNGAVSNSYSLRIVAPLDGTKLYYQRWSDVLAINNNPANNGGYHVLEYRWYRQGSSTVIGTGGYIEITGAASGYYAEVLTQETGEWHRVCGTPATRATAEAVVAYPNPVSIGETLNVQIPEEFVGGTLTIYDLNGAVYKKDIVLRNKLNPVSISDLMPNIYLLRVTSKNGESQTVKIIVK